MSVTERVTGDASATCGVTHGDAFSGFNASRARAKQDLSERVTRVTGPILAVEGGDACDTFSQLSDAICAGKAGNRRSRHLQKIKNRQIGRRS